MPSPTSAPRSRAIAAGFAPDSLALALRQRDRDGARRRARARGVRPAVPHRAGGRRPAAARRMPSGSTPRSRPRRGPARCSPRSRRGRTTARDARRSSASSRVPRRRPRRSRRRMPARCGSCGSSCRHPNSTRLSPSTATSLGMPQAEAYEAEGGARVVILDAGRATLELANPAQVAFIDRVETDGGTSDRIRLALEVDDTARWRSGSPPRAPRSRHPLASHRGAR